MLSEESGQPERGPRTGGGHRPRRRVDQCVEGDPLVRHQPVRGRRRGATGRARGATRPPVCASRRCAGGGARRDGVADPTFRVRAAGRGHRGLQRLSAQVLRLAPVPVPRCSRPRPVRGGRGRARRLRRGRRVEARELGLSRAGCWSAPRPAPSSARPREGNSSPCPMPTGGHRSRRPRRRCWRSSSPPGRSSVWACRAFSSVG